MIKKIGCLGEDIKPLYSIEDTPYDDQFTACIACLLSTYPQSLYDLFLFDKNEAGLYVVRLFIDGEW